VFLYDINREKIDAALDAYVTGSSGMPLQAKSRRNKADTILKHIAVCGGNRRTEKRDDRDRMRF